MKAFHEGHPDVALELQVTRHPFSFIGDLDERQIEAGSSLKKKGTWRDRLLDYTGGNEHMRDQAMMGMIQAGKPLGIKFDYNCYIDRQPIDSQRMLLYAASHGKQEAYVSALSKRHFEHGSDGESASKRHTVLAAAAEAGLDYDDAAQFYDGDLLRSDVWKSYGDMPRRGISAIPLFVFNVPEIGLEGGPLRPHVNGKIKPPIVNGSMQVDLFVEIFTQIWEAVAKHRGVGGPVPARRLCLHSRSSNRLPSRRGREHAARREAREAFEPRRAAGAQWHARHVHAVRCGKGAVRRQAPYHDASAQAGEFGGGGG